MPEDVVGEVLRRLPYGFYSITSRNGDEVNAMVLTWITRASFEPRLVGLALQRASHTYGLVKAGHVGSRAFSLERSAFSLRPFASWDDAARSLENAMWKADGWGPLTSGHLRAFAMPRGAVRTGIGETQRRAPV